MPENSQSVIVITGVAGFIGSSVAHSLLKLNNTIIGIDNLNPAYSSKFKLANLALLQKYPPMYFYKCNISDKKSLLSIFKKHKPNLVIHLAALTGIRTSLQFPKEYNQINIVGTQTVFEVAALHQVQSFLFSSSSSIYGNSKRIPFKENQTPDPRSPYARTKLAAEQILKKLSTKHRIPTTVFRLFSVYGPRGRPDMAPYLFTQAAFAGTTVPQYGNGNAARDYTYIGDVTKAFEIAIKKSFVFETINIGNSAPVTLSKLVSTVEKLSKQKINRSIESQNPAESLITFANTDKATKLLGWQPKIPFTVGMNRFIKWYQKHRL